MRHITRRVTYRGNPAFASMLAQMLEEGGGHGRVGATY